MNKITDRKKTPNILWIVLDHVTFRHFRMTKGAKPILSTYERLAAQGVEFTNCHSVHPLCLPARATMMTGVYSHKHGKINNGKHWDAGYPLMHEYLKEMGYRTGYFGKNHNGYEDLKERGMEGYYPEGYGNPYKTEEYKDYLEKNGLSHPIYHQEWGMETDRHIYENAEYDLTEGGNFNTYSAGYIKTPGPVHEADFLVSMASDWIAARSKEEAPFMVRVDLWGPHHAFQVPQEYRDLINPEEIEEYPSFRDDMKNKPQFVQDFLARIRSRNPNKSWEEWQPVMKRAYENYSYIDAALGRLLDQLEAEGISENTVVIYTADHGDALGSHGGMVDKAGDLMEEVMHIPMVIRGPEVAKGHVSNALVSNLDIVPTVLEIAGMKPPRHMDGKSMVPLLAGSKEEWRDDFMAQHYGHFQVNTVQRALYYKNFKYIANTGEIHEIYDLERDPFELDNRIGDPGMQSTLQEMAKRLLEKMECHGDDGETVQALKTQISSLVY